MTKNKTEMHREQATNKTVLGKMCENLKRRMPKKGPKEIRKIAEWTCYSNDKQKRKKGNNCKAK
jgi:hypothetical protein